MHLAKYLRGGLDRVSYYYSKLVKIFSCSIYLICIACDTIFLLAIHRFVAKMFMWDWFTGMLNYLGEFFREGKLIKKSIMQLI